MLSTLARRVAAFSLLVWLVYHGCCAENESTMTTATTNSGDGPGTARHFQGSLAQTPLAEVLRQIAVEERSGDLQITGPSFIKTIYLDKGFVVFASSNRKTDRLGESMIEAGRISRHEFALASMLMKTTKQKFGAVLVEAGIVPEEELGRFVAAQVNRIVLSLFMAKQGNYRFDERPCSIPVELMVSLSVYRILIEGVRRISRKSLILAGLPSLDTEVKIVDQPPFTLDVDKLRSEEKSVLRAAKNGATIQDIVDIVGGHEGVSLRACYGLLSGGLLEPVEPDPRRRLLQVQEETGTFVLSEIRHKVEAPEEPVDAPATPRAELAPPSAQFQRDVEPQETRVEASDGFTLGDVYDWFARLWNTVRGWFGGSRKTALEEPAQKIAPTKAPAPVPAPEPSQVESVDARSWSFEDDSEETRNEKPAVESVGVPSWSLKEEETDPPADQSDTLGVPSWSMKDDSESSTSSPVIEEDRAPEPPAPEPPAPEPRSEMMEPPSWSIVDSPLAEDDPPEDELLDTSQSLDIGSDIDDEPLPDMDSELFVDGEGEGEGGLSGNDEISMLRQIPIEEVELSQDIEIELEEEEIPETAETPPAEPAQAEPEVAEKPTPTPQARVTPPEPKPAAPSTSMDYEIKHDESKGTSHEQEMRRMMQSGGESRLLRDVKLHFRMRDWQGAVPLLEQLVAISPGKAFYRGMLARAMSRDPATRKDAEEHFIQALRLAPQDPELHYWLGLYYKSFGLKSRALTEFRTTLRINAKHEGARKQLGGGRKKDDALGGVFKKLFG